MNTFPYKSFISASWQAFKKHWKFLVLAILATGVLQVILQMIQTGSERSGTFGSIVAAIVVGLFGIIITLGWSRALLAVNREDAASWNTFKTQPRIWLHYIKAMIWYALYFIGYAIVAVILPAALGVIGLATGVPALAMIGWGIAAAVFVAVVVYFAVRYQFMNFVVLDNQGLRSRAVFKKSGDLTKGYFWALLGFGIILGLINILGAICLVVGLLVTIPLTKLAAARAYDFLKNEKRSEAEVVVTETVIVEEVVA